MGAGGAEAHSDPTSCGAIQSDENRAGKRRTDDGRRRRLPAVATRPRTGREGDSQRIRGISDQGIGNRSYRPLEDLYGRSASHDGASHHEHAGVSNRLDSSWSPFGGLDVAMDDTDLVR